MLEEEDVIFRSVKCVGVITLNRPKALNALNHSMARKLTSKLLQWEKEKNLVIIKGNGGKAFCAGGDVRHIVQAVLNGERIENQFSTDYAINDLIGSYGISYIAIMDGIVMGGGVGISVNGQYRVATERTVFAMPETAIGWFPDAGATYFLPRLRGKLGYYLGLTGHRLKGTDVLNAGIATHYCESRKLASLEEALLETSSSQEIEKVLTNFCSENMPPFSLEPNLEKINTCFAAPTVEGILEELNKDGSVWAHSTAEILNKMSPTSLKVALKALNMGARLTLQECIAMEYRIAIRLMANKDFHEGVRAHLIDKNGNPKWNPSCLLEVTDQIVNGYIDKLPEGQEMRSKL